MLPFDDLIGGCFINRQHPGNVPGGIRTLFQICTRFFAVHLMIFHLAGIPLFEAFTNHPHLPKIHPGFKKLLVDQPVAVSLLQPQDTAHLRYGHQLR